MKSCTSSTPIINPFFLMINCCWDWLYGFNALNRHNIIYIELEMGFIEKNYKQNQTCKYFGFHFKDLADRIQEKVNKWKWNARTLFWGLYVTKVFYL